MNMRNTKVFTPLSIVLGFLISAICSAQQPPTANTKQPESPTIPAATKCPAVAEVLAVLGQKKVYEQIPELFLPTVAGQLKSIKDETKPLSPSEKFRTISLAPTSGDWLTNGEAAYRVLNERAEFNGLSLEINKNCFGNPKEFIALGKNTIGKGSKAVKLDDTEMLMWRWKDPDINMVRTLEINASQSNYSIAVKRDPDSSGAGG